VFGSRSQFVYFLPVHSSFIMNIYSFVRSCVQQTRNTETMTWEELIVKGAIPSKRCGHGVWLTRNREMMIFGGWGEKGARLNDVHAFDVGETGELFLFSFFF
jgi:hypothetical protein